MARPRLDKSGEPRKRVVLMLTDSEETYLKDYLFLLRTQEFTAPKPTGLTATKLELSAPKPKRSGKYATEMAEILVPLPTVTLNPEGWPVINEAPYTPSMRECGICGKDYDGNMHDKCPYPHVPNNPRRK